MTEAHPSIPPRYLHAGLADLREWEDSRGRGSNTHRSITHAGSSSTGSGGLGSREPTIHVHRTRRRSSEGDGAGAGPPSVYGAEKKTKASPALKALAGSVGGLVEALTLQPVVRPTHPPTHPTLQDTIKTRMQLNPALYPGMVSSGRRIIAEESIPALWKGTSSSSSSFSSPNP